MSTAPAALRSTFHSIPENPVPYGTIFSGPDVIHIGPMPQKERLRDFELIGQDGVPVSGFVGQTRLGRSNHDVALGKHGFRWYDLLDWAKMVGADC